VVDENIRCDSQGINLPNGCFSKNWRASSLERCQGEIVSNVSMYQRMRAASVQSPPEMATARAVGSFNSTSRLLAQVLGGRPSQEGPGLLVN
jgi:hypothetical protein